jgi:hypothetical protein
LGAFKIYNFLVPLGCTGENAYYYRIKRGEYFLLLSDAIQEEMQLNHGGLSLALPALTFVTIAFYTKLEELGQSEPIKQSGRKRGNGGRETERHTFIQTFIHMVLNKN